MLRKFGIGDVVLYRDVAGVVSPGIINGVNRDLSFDMHVFPQRSASYNVMAMYEASADEPESIGWFAKPDYNPAADPGPVAVSGPSAQLPTGGELKELVARLGEIEKVLSDLQDSAMQSDNQIFEIAAQARALGPQEG